MRYYADLHIHSKYSRACSKDCDIEHLTWWARRKGITVVGTGDFTHPAWFAHLQDVLEPAEPGLFRLRRDHARDVDRSLPPSCAGDVRFMLSVEISTIYKYGDLTRKVHHLCYVPDFAAAEEFNRQLARIGNLGSDGRPILGLDSRDLLEITLQSGDGAYLVPAHVWTPWFAVLGSKAGFNSVDECYRDLSGHIFAVETGLSSDPGMNWRVSMLDRYTLVSHSDAHSPPMLGREASVFDTAVDYFAIRRALETGSGYQGTVEFFPEEGKYHLDGHRKCGVRFEPPETHQHRGRCPACGKPLTVGVLNRVDELADRPEGIRPSGAAGFRNLIRLPEIVGEAFGVGPKSKKVLREIDALTAAHGPELVILEDVPLDDLKHSSPLLAEAIRRLRDGEVIREAGYDGEYGTIRLFEPGEADRLRTDDAPGLFDESPYACPPAAPATSASAAPSLTPPDVSTDVPGPDGIHHAADVDTGEPAEREETVDGVLAGLDAEQRAAAHVPAGPLLIVAGPGAGKTRTVTHRIAHQVRERGVAPAQCLAITFTRRAAEELSERLRALVGADAAAVTVATFHSFALRLLREHPESAGLAAGFGIADAAVQHELLTEVTGDEAAARRLQPELARARRGESSAAPELEQSLRRYVGALRERNLVDFDGLILSAVRLLRDHPDVLHECRERFRWITVDEYQDIDHPQYELLRLLAPADANLTAIGDPDQAIYSFRGADVGFFLRFEQDYPQAPVVRLGRNYRSGRCIVDGALQVIRPTTLVADRRLRAMRQQSTHRITTHRAGDEQAEAAYVAETVDQLLGGASFHSHDVGRVRGDEGGEIGFADIAVLYRTDAQSRAVVDELTRHGFPVQKRSHDPLTARAGVEHILRELTHLSPAQESGCVLDRVRAAASAAQVTLPGEQLPELHTALDLLTPLARRCGDDVERFVHELLLGAEVDTLDPRADAISLLTLHASKGLEYPVVFLVGCEDDLLPLRWPGRDLTHAQLAEERRLFFVGMTRAQDRLFLTSAARRTRHGGTRETALSPFLAALPAAVTEEVTATPRRPRARQLSLI